jgi:lactoylglutathione lyase
MTSVTSVSLNLVVFTASNLDLAVKFYSSLGLKFSEHQHGHGPKHFAADLGGCVFELYPLAPDAQSSAGTRVGFRVPSLAATLDALSQFPNCVVSPPKNSPWGLRAVLKDPDGHRVELIEAEA